MQINGFGKNLKQFIFSILSCTRKILSRVRESRTTTVGEHLITRSRRKRWRRGILHPASPATIVDIPAPRHRDSRIMSQPSSASHPTVMQSILTTTLPLRAFLSVRLRLHSQPLLRRPYMFAGPSISRKRCCITTAFGANLLHLKRDIRINEVNNSKIN